VWGSGPNDVWAVGGSGVEGVITHYDGTSWHLAFTSSLTRPAGVWGTGPSDVWTAGQPFGGNPGGNNSILHFLGSGWNPVADNAFDAQSKVLTSVWASGPGDAWAVGFGEKLHWNGTAWAPSPSAPGNFEHVWGRAANDLWVVGLDVGGSGLVH